MTSLAEIVGWVNGQEPDTVMTAVAGFVKQGVVVPDSAIPEGAKVEIRVSGESPDILKNPNSVVAENE